MPGYKRRQQQEPSTKVIKAAEQKQLGDKSVRIPCCYLCRLPDDTYHKADVLAKRLNKGAVEYYVHYRGIDRRMDDWLKVENIDLEKGPILEEVSVADESDAAAGDRNRLTRNQKRKHDGEKVAGNSWEIEVVNKTTAAIEREHEELTKIKYVSEIQFGKFFMKAWYFSPYPDEYGKCPLLHICSYCLQYMKLEESFRLHECRRRHPPGKRIYRKSNISVYEVDSSVDKLYCQNLCLLAKLFLDHKTLYYDVEPFMFYVMTEDDGRGHSMVGYFSKEKDSPELNNLACILILPPFQRRSFGKFLISFSYELSKIEGRRGSPEKPLSDLGRLSYLSYWKLELLKCLDGFAGRVTLDKLGEMTGMTHCDLVTTMHALGMIKHWRGKGQVCITPQHVRQLVADPRHFKPLTIPVDAKLIHWQPHKPSKPKQ